MQGIITKGVGGVYEVKVISGGSFDGRVLCAARGGIRNRKITPAIGDNVVISETSDPDVPRGFFSAANCNLLRCPARLPAAARSTF